MADPTTSVRSLRGGAGLAVAVAVAAVLIVWALGTGGPTLLVQRLVDGATNGVLYGILAVALVLVFKATKVINFAQGSMAMLGAYLALTLIDAAVPVVIVTLALFLGLNAAVALVWGFSPKTFPSLFPLGQDAYVDVLGARLDYADIGTLLVALAVIVVIEVVLRRSRLGLAFRAVANSVESARLLGIPVGRTVQFSWALAAAAGTLAACLIAPTTFLDPIFMNKILIYAFAAATLGGLDSIGGALAGGVLVGVVISMLEYVPALGGESGLAAAFVIIVVVLQVRPAGLWGRRAVERV